MRHILSDRECMCFQCGHLKYLMHVPFTHPPATFMRVESVCELKFFHPVAIERRLCFAARHFVVAFVGAIQKLLNKYRDLLFKNRMENRAS